MCIYLCELLAYLQTDLSASYRTIHPWEEPLSIYNKVSAANGARARGPTSCVPIGKPPMEVRKQRPFYFCKIIEKLLKNYWKMLKFTAFWPVSPY